MDTTSPFDMADAAIERYVYDDIHTGLASLDGGNVVLDFVDTDGSGSQPIALAKRYLYGAAVDQILVQEDVTKTLSDAARVLWPLTDNLGTTRDVARQDGTIATHLKYDAYGNVTAGDTSLTRYLFTSRELDTDTGLQYNRARWYDPAVGRWLSEDPLGFAAGDGNFSRYVGNGVVAATDPSGFDRTIYFFLHAWITVDVYDSNGKVIGQKELHFSPKGYTIEPVSWAYPSWFPIATRKSSWKEDVKLIELWKVLERDRREGRVHGWNPGNNCFIQTSQHADFGIDWDAPERNQSEPSSPLPKRFEPAPGFGPVSGE